MIKYENFKLIEQIEAEREKEGFTQKSFSSAIGISYFTYRAYAQKINPMKVDVLMKAAAILNFKKINLKTEKLEK